VTAGPPPMILLVAFIAVVLAVLSGSALFFKSKDAGRRINRRLSMLDAGTPGEQVFEKLVRRSAAPRLQYPGLADAYDRAETYLIQAGIGLPLPRLIAYTAGAGAAIWLTGLVFVAKSQGDLVVNGLFSLIGAAVLAVLGAYTWVGRKRAARLKRLEEQLPVALEIVTRAIRAGHPVVSAVQLAGNELPDPLGSEFGLVVDETSYGADFKDALTSFARRTGSQDAHYFAVAVAIQGDTGGNLAEILDGLAKVMRGRATLGKRVKALASEGKASAYLLSALPVVLITFQMVFNPTFYTSKFADPIFWPTMAGVCGLYMVGWLIIRRIINFRY
jgi:tight adherence protein B